MDKLEIKKLLAAFINGDNSSLKDIFVQHGDFCVKNLMRKTKCSQEDSEDIFIESVMNFREKVLSGEIKQITNIRNYLYTTCFNMWSSKTQKKNVFNKRLTDIERFYYQEFEFDPIVSIEETNYHHSLLDLSKKAFQKLSDKCQDILYFFYVEKLSMKEISKIADASNAGVAKVLKFRCMKQYAKLTEELLKESANVSR